MTDSKTLQQIIGSNVKKGRMKKQITQAKLAELAGISIPHMTNIERGKTWLGVDLLVKISEILGMEPYMLLVDPVSFRAPLKYQLQRQSEEFLDIFKRALINFEQDIENQIDDTISEDYKISHASHHSQTLEAADSTSIKK